MATEFKELEIWVVVDEDGDHAAGVDREDAETHFEEQIGFSNEKATRRVKVTVKVPLPKPLEVVGTVIEEEPAAS